MTRNSITPKKLRSYKEFLYIVPFLILVGLFSYFPLYGWIYAFHDYMPPKPIGPDTWVGLKWFTTIVNSPVRAKAVLRVLRNTFAMSGISLLFSWVPMIFAVFLNEIKCRPFKKVVQTVTTLPNFISWVLVFSFAFNLFSSNGAVNTILSELGLIEKPVQFLRMTDNIYFRQWLWLTWKNAGWASIMYLAAITGIDEQMYEAAKVDGATVDDAKYAKIMEFLNWYAGDESMMIQHAGLEGFNYEINEEGKPVAMNSDALMNNLTVPEIYGGGGYQDGFNAINQWIGASICTNRELNEIYSATFWSTADPTFAAGWREHYSASNAIDYMKQHDQLLASPSVPFVAPSDPADIELIRNDVKTSLTKYTWQMFFAETDEEFEAMWDAMVEEVDAYGYNDLFDYDVSVYQPEVDAKLEAIANAQ